MSAVAHLLPGARVLDLYAGSGALGLEALSRGAAHAVFVDHAPTALAVIRRNLTALGADGRADVVRADAATYAQRSGVGAFDVAFADPPYGADFATLLVRSFLAHPFASLLCVEHGRAEQIDAGADSNTRRYGDTSLTFVTAPG